MKFDDFLEILKQKKISAKNCVEGFNFDSIIMSEADASEFLVDADIDKIRDRIIIVDSDFLLSANIDGANKYKQLCELTRKHQLKHLMLTKSGTLNQAVLLSKMLKPGSLNLSLSCKVVAPYFENGFAVLPFDAQVSSKETLFQGCVELPENLQVFEINLDNADYLSETPEKIAFSIIKGLNKLKEIKQPSKFDVILWKTEYLSKISAHHRNRIFGLLNSADYLSFEGSTQDFDVKTAEALFKQVTIKNLQVQFPKSNLMLDDSVKIITENQDIEAAERVFLGGCTAGDIKNIEEIAEFVAGKKLTRKIEVILTPSDFETYHKAAESGFLAEISRAGIIIAMPSCATCKGKHTGVLADNEIALSSFPLGEKARHGSALSTVYRVSLQSILKFLFTN